MSPKLEVGVIGLGKFGLGLALALKELGAAVLCIDQNKEAVDRAQELFSHVYQADGTDKTALEQLSFQLLPHVVISVGKSMEDSIMTVMNLQELGVEKIWVKAIGPPHKKVLERLGVELVVIPEVFVARQIAHRIAVPGIVEYVSLGESIVIKEYNSHNWQGQTLRQLDLTNRFQVQVIAIKKEGKDTLDFVPKADEPLRRGDTLILLGEVHNVQRVS